MITSSKVFRKLGRNASTVLPIRHSSSNPIVFIEGVRTPFLASLTDYQHMMPHQLLAQAYTGLIDRTGVAASEIDYLCAGTVQQEIRLSNIAKEAGFEAKLPKNIPGHTVAMACISSNQAVATCMGRLATGESDLCIAGGVEFCSDQPIRYPRTVRQLLMKAPRAKTVEAKMEVAELAKNFNLKAFVPELPDPREFSSNEVMGQYCDRLNAMFGVSREDQDSFGLRSHELAAAAAKAGHLSDIVPVIVPGREAPVTVDNGIRPSTMEKLGKLRPAFSKDGTVTAANASFLSDGATACLITTESKAKELGLKPKAYLRNVLFASADPMEELLLGPAFATPKLLEKTGLTLADIDVFEIHEAFSGQVLANLVAMNSDSFCQKRVGVKGKVGEIPHDKMNLWGGSVSLGHPFGATGIRLISHAVNRLHQEDGARALITACAANAQGVAMIVERYPM